MQIKKSLILRNVAGDYILVPVGKTILNTTGLFVLNELGAFIWERLPAAETEEDILEAVLSEFEVGAEEARQDISEFMD